MKHWRKPLGATQPARKRYRIQVLSDRCKGCKLCIEFCPKHVLHESADFNAKGYHPAYADEPNDCLNCGYCELVCPEFAVHVVPTKDSQDSL